MAIWVCGSPARCCQPSVAGGVIYADLRRELSTHLAPQALFTLSSSWRHRNCYKLSHFQAHWGRWHCTHFLRPACLFTVHVGRGSSPISCAVFLPPPLLQAFLVLVAGRVLPLLPSPAGLFWGISPPPALQPSGRPAFFTVVIAYYSVFFSFFPAWGSVCLGGYADLAQGVCASTECCLAHLVVWIFPSHPVIAVWQQCRSPPGFSV
jgi:hypothetical protein